MSQAHRVVTCDRPHDAEAWFELAIALVQGACDRAGVDCGAEDSGSPFCRLEEAIFCFARAIREDEEAATVSAAAARMRSIAAAPTISAHASARDGVQVGGTLPVERRRRLSQARCNLAGLMVRVRANFADAEAQYRLVLRNDPLHPQAHFMVGALIEV